jgi:hypothetical protein
MANYGVMAIGVLMSLVGLITGYANSYLVMQLIGATTTMWVLWYLSIALIILGSIILKLSE